MCLSRLASLTSTPLAGLLTKAGDPGRLLHMCLDGVEDLHRCPGAKFAPRGPPGQTGERALLFEWDILGRRTGIIVTCSCDSLCLGRTHPTTAKTKDGTTWHNNPFSLNNPILDWYLGRPGIHFRFRNIPARFCTGSGLGKHAVAKGGFSGVGEPTQKALRMQEIEPAYLSAP